ncbi:hypothetical protein VTH06DRAFT_982 [Thermothelomyces fergusii]
MLISGFRRRYCIAVLGSVIAGVVLFTP